MHQRNGEYKIYQSQLGELFKGQISQLRISHKIIPANIAPEVSPKGVACQVLRHADLSLKLAVPIVAGGACLHSSFC
jgi:hypothetical protein